MTVDLHRLRDLRAHAEERSSTFVEDFRPFLLKDNTFCRTPEQAKDPDPSVTTVCTCLMAAALTGRLARLYTDAGRKDPHLAAKEGFRKIVDAAWMSAGLSEGNNFTRVLALRAAGLLKREGILTSRDLKNLRHRDQTLEEICREMVGQIPESFGVQGFGPKSAMAYWFLDAIEHLDINVTRPQVSKLVDWATGEFRHQFSYVTANYDALLDPVAMIMAACVVKRLHQWRANGRLVPASVYERLPPIAELRHSVTELFRFQGKSGIWPKYFPLFNYPKTQSSNYCFTFDLEAALGEFSDPESHLFDTPNVLTGLELALEWCDENRLGFIHEGAPFFGWNSGTEISLLRAGVPESWATGTIHMFLAKLREALSEAIDRSVVASWLKARESEEWDKLIDAPMQLRGGEPGTTLKTIIAQQILDKVVPHPECRRSSYRRRPIQHRRSAVLFGPPGTSKTTLVRSLARMLNWPYIEITPSDFVGNGMDQIYARTTEIFSDLMDLAGAVVLFDEMDALAAKRAAQFGTEQLDVVRQLLTTSMLPMLADLHDRKQIIYFMNTNHRNGIDSAIMRAGRFDMLLHVVPPTWSEKLKHLDIVYRADPGEVKNAIGRLRSWTAKAAKERAVLDRFTVAETRSFFEHIRRTRGHEKLSQALAGWNQHSFLQLAMEWGRSFIVLKEDSPELEEYRQDLGTSSLQ